MPSGKSDEGLDYLHWKRLERWPAPAAACLLLGIDPKGRLGGAIASSWFSEEHRVESARDRLPASAR
ncbi:MAG TPA: hypothetical protein VHM25_09900, partial [Polyangiaceae bacterium]|nr:hypothetical protein [Polyangiaceae bacterium]